MQEYQNLDYGPNVAKINNIAPKENTFLFPGFLMTCNLSSHFKLQVAGTGELHSASTSNLETAQI